MADYQAPAITAIGVLAEITLDEGSLTDSTTLN